MAGQQGPPPGYGYRPRPPGPYGPHGGPYRSPGPYGGAPYGAGPYGGAGRVYRRYHPEAARRARRFVPPVPVPDPPERATALPMTLPARPGAHSRRPSLPAARRVPDDLPLVLRWSMGKLVLAFVLGLAVAAAASVGGGLLLGGPLLATILGVLVLAAVVLGFVFWRLLPALNGPILAADRDRLWLHSRKFPVAVVGVPWELAGEIYVVRWLWTTSVCVRPRDDRIDESDRHGWAIQQLTSAALHGARFTASLTYSRSRRDDVLTRLTELAAGRARVTRRRAKEPARRDPVPFAGPSGSTAPPVPPPVPPPASAPTPDRASE